MESNVRDKILSRSRAKDWKNWQPRDFSLKEVRDKFGGASDEELLLRVYAGTDAVNALTNGGAPKPALDGRQPLFRLIEELSKKKDCNQIFIRKPGFALALRKAAGATAD
jgi:hypothetical protein